MKMKKIKTSNSRTWKICAGMLCGAMMLQSTLLNTSAQTNNSTRETEMISGEENETVGVGEVYAFGELGADVRSYHINKADKPSLESLLNAFPQTLEVFVEGSDSAVAVDVTWYCVGEDYADPDAYYFQFSPKWDEEKYPAAQHINIIKDAPYIAVFFYDEDGMTKASVTGKENEKIIYDFLRNQMRLNAAAASGILANIYHESSFNPNAVGDNGTSYGICQWHNERWEAMQRWCQNNGHDWTSLIGQLHYLQFELSQNNPAYLWNGLRIYNYISKVSDTSEGAYDAGYYWCYYFEVPANREQVAVTRGNLAKHVYWREYGKVFDDVEVDVYYDIPIRWAVEKGITNGIGENLFAPEEECTRGQVVTFLWRAAGSPEPTACEHSFTDIAEGAYYYKAVLWAVENGITEGYGSDDIFNPEGACTRGQVVTFLWRVADQPEPVESENPFSDVLSGEYYDKAVLWAVENGITNGYGSDTTFNPGGICTRGQIVTFLYRAMN